MGKGCTLYKLPSVVYYDARESVDAHKPQGASYRSNRLLLCADLAHEVRKYIIPDLVDGKIVIADRFADSGVVYSTAHSAERLGLMLEMHEYAAHGITPDLTIWLDTPHEVAFERQTTEGGERVIPPHELRLYEKQYERVLTMPGRVDVVRIPCGDPTSEEVWAQVEELVDEHLSICRKDGR